MKNWDVDVEWTVRLSAVAATKEEARAAVIDALARGGVVSGSSHEEGSRPEASEAEIVVRANNLGGGPVVYSRAAERLSP